ncbi:uncharacterized protein BDZ99DRAFT_106772 [Mytilinidion resinicola]|uniref:Uncharacterized protein n=1 Tax=Mytilinidion resinicola TaxID=574789 RepID=A0A6A6YA81_9PEZI|nr:uncharacterized protein BDZ99DRAFT_106772 [Mytilinidion resinicola]KAF2805529.1 hypothetical protein BDZ99DRAFT_106772 [Mytilinidion resinicola]
MSHRVSKRHEYQALEDDDLDSGSTSRLSTSSNSPILPKPDVDEFEEDDTLQGDGDGNTFDTDGLETFYEPVEGYEGAHRYDPKYRWSKVDEQIVVRKVRDLLFVYNTFPILSVDVRFSTSWKYRHEAPVTKRASIKYSRFLTVYFEPAIFPYCL